jgi:hypothetical protein
LGFIVSLFVVLVCAVGCFIFFKALEKYFEIHPLDWTGGTSFAIFGL